MLLQSGSTSSSSNKFTAINAVRARELYYQVGQLQHSVGQVLQGLGGIETKLRQLKDSNGNVFQFGERPALWEASDEKLFYHHPDSA